MNCMSRTLIATALLLGGTSLPVLAADGPHDEAIKARQAMFHQFDFNLGILSAMAKGEIPYDAELATHSAANLASVSALHQDAFWPEGSDSETDGNARTRALPAIWENMEEVQQKFADLSADAESLTAVAGGGLDVLQDSIGEVGGNCKGCHDVYRASRR